MNERDIVSEHADRGEPVGRAEEPREDAEDQEQARAERAAEPVLHAGDDLSVKKKPNTCCG